MQFLELGGDWVALIENAAMLVRMFVILGGSSADRTITISCPPLKQLLIRFI